MKLHTPEHIKTLVPYVPGKPIEETQRELGLKRVIKLASNENPLGPSPKAIRALKRAQSELHRYPDANAFQLKQALAKACEVPAGQIVVGSGSDELIDLLIRSCCDAGDEIVTSFAAFVSYKIRAHTQGVKTLEVPMTADLRFDLPAVLDTVRRNDRARIVFIPNPNNPTGTYVREDELREFLRGIREIRGGEVLVVLDYAYWEYVTVRDLPDALVLAREFSNVVVLRTFSKAYGLAGLRVGYGIGGAELIANLEKIRMPFSLNSQALLAARAALEDRAFVKKARALNAAGLKFWEKGLKSLGIPFWPSQGNFFLIDTLRGLGRPGVEVYKDCLARGVIFRPVANYSLHHALRISVGTAEENRIALAALKACRDGVPPRKPASAKSQKKPAPAKSRRRK